MHMLRMCIMKTFISFRSNICPYPNKNQPANFGDFLNNFQNNGSYSGKLL